MTSPGPYSITRPLAPKREQSTVRSFIIFLFLTVIPLHINPKQSILWVYTVCCTHFPKNSFFHNKLCFRNSSMWVHTAGICLAYSWPSPRVESRGKWEEAPINTKYRTAPNLIPYLSPWHPSIRKEHVSRVYVTDYLRKHNLVKGSLHVHPCHL